MVGLLSADYDHLWGKKKKNNILGPAYSLMFLTVSGKRQTILPLRLLLWLTFGEVKKSASITSAEESEIELSRSKTLV